MREPFSSPLEPELQVMRADLEAQEHRASDRALELARAEDRVRRSTEALDTLRARLRAARLQRLERSRDWATATIAHAVLYEQQIEEELVELERVHSRHVSDGRVAVHGFEIAASDVERTRAQLAVLEERCRLQRTEASRRALERAHEATLDELRMRRGTVLSWSENRERHDRRPSAGWSPR